MSSDYRPRTPSGSSSGGNSSGGGGRRRRGGRGRHQRGGPGGQGRSHSNGSHSGAPKKKESFLDKVVGFFTGGKKDKPAAPRLSGPASVHPTQARAEMRDRPPRAERPPREDRPPREPVMLEIVSPKLYVGNLAYEAGESDLFDLFSKVGAVKNVEVATDRHAGRSKGFGFVEMETLETAKAAAEKLNRTDFMGRQIVVSGAKVDRRPSRESESESEPDNASTEGDSTI
jgi:hypothetical protein